MKKFITIIFTVLLLPPSLSQAEADGPDYWDITNVASNDVLNIREEASAKTRIMGSLSADKTCLKNLGCEATLSLSEYMALSEQEKKQQKNKYHWCKIKYNNLTGWVLNKYIKESSHACHH